MMQFNKKVTAYFDEAAHGGLLPQAEQSLTSLQGHTDRTQVLLCLAYEAGIWQARFLATGGVVSIAACEYWARHVDIKSGHCSVKASVIMQALDIDPKWLSDVFLIEQASKALQQQWKEYADGRNHR